MIKTGTCATRCYGSVFFALLPVVGCKPAPLSAKAELVEVEPHSVVFRVTTAPGAKVRFELGEATEVPSGGTIDVRLPRQDWHSYLDPYVEVRAEKRGLLGAVEASARAPVPVPVSALLALPETPRAAGLVASLDKPEGDYVGLRPEGPGGTLPWPAEKPLHAVFAAPKGAKLVVAGTSLVVGANGLVEATLPASAVAGCTKMESVARPPTQIALTVSIDGAAAPDLEYRVDTPGSRSAWLARYVSAALATPSLVSASPVQAVLRLDSHGTVTHHGAAGRARDARYIATETVVAKGDFDCQYTGGKRVHSVFEEVTVTVRDIRAGVDVAKKTFAPPPGGCSDTILGNAGDRFIRVSEASLDEWLSRGLATSFH